MLIMINESPIEAVSIGSRLHRDNNKMKLLVPVSPGLLPHRSLDDRRAKRIVDDGFYGLLDRLTKTIHTAVSNPKTVTS
jgi:hypothetical protein